MCDRTFVGKLFTDYITDGIIPSEYLLSVIPQSVSILVGNTKKTFTDGFTDGPCAPKKKSFPLGIYRRKIFRRCYVNTDGLHPSVNVSVIFHTDRIFPSVNSSVFLYRRIISVGEYVGDGMEYRRHCLNPSVNMSVMGWNTADTAQCRRIYISSENPCVIFFFNFLEKII